MVLLASVWRRLLKFVIVSLILLLICLVSYELNYLLHGFCLGFNRSERGFLLHAIHSLIVALWVIYFF